MTELEHFIKREDISTFGRVCSIAISIKTRDDDYCDNHNCGECDFCKNKDEILKILLSEHQEKPQLTDDEKAILRTSNLNLNLLPEIRIEFCLFI